MENARLQEDNARLREDNARLQKQLQAALSENSQLRAQIPSAGALPAQTPAAAPPAPTASAPAVDSPPKTPTKLSLEVQIAADREALLRICHLRYHVYVEELKRDNYAHADNVQKVIEDSLDHVDGVYNLYVDAPAGAAEKLAACARIHVPVPDTYTAMFGTNDQALFPDSEARHFALFSRFMVHASFRGRGGATDLVSAAVRATRDLRARAVHAAAHRSCRSAGLLEELRPGQSPGR